MDHASIAAFRLLRHRLSDRARPRDLVAVAKAALGVQAQLPSAARLAFRARVEGLTSAEVDQAIHEDRSLVRTWSVRGTVHLLARDDFPLFAAFLRRRALAGVIRWFAMQGVTEREAHVMKEAVVEALSDGPLTRKEISERIGHRFRAAARKLFTHSWGAGVRPAVAEGSVVFGPPRGQETTFVRVDRWLGRVRLPDDPGPALLRRYLAAYGPATLADFSHWSGAPAKDAAPHLEALGAEVESLRLDDEKLLVLARDRAALSRARGGVVRLLGHFDPYLLAHRGKGHLVDDRHYKAVYRKAAWVSAVILVDGRVAGVWSGEARRGRFEVRVNPFAPLARARREALDAEVADLGQFLEMPAALVRG